MVHEMEARNVVSCRFETCSFELLADGSLRRATGRYQQSKLCGVGDGGGTRGHGKLRQCVGDVAVDGMLR
jgi:hypothetical protein